MNYNYKIKRKRILEYLIQKSRNVIGMSLVVISRKQISRKLKISESSVWRATKWLVWHGNIKIYKKKGHAHLYEILWEEIE